MAARTIQLDPREEYASAEELLPIVAERLHRIGARRIRLGPTSVSFEGGILRERPGARLAARIDQGRIHADPGAAGLRWELGRRATWRDAVSNLAVLLLLILGLRDPGEPPWAWIWPWGILYGVLVAGVYVLFDANRRLARRLFTVWLERCVEQSGARLARPASPAEPRARGLSRSS